MRKITKSDHNEIARSKSKALTAKDIQKWLVYWVSEELGIEPNEINIREPLASYSLGSLQALILSGDLEKWLGRRLSPTLVYNYPSISALSRYLASHSDISTSVTSLDPILTVESIPIAIIGIGCRFPGGADNPEAFWQFLKAGVDGISEVPPDRWDINAYYNPDPEIAGKMVTRWGGFLENVDKFDAGFFSISPREANYMDPQQRLLLEVTWEALENAGQTREILAESQTGIFIGVCSNDYALINSADPNQITAYAGSGTAHSVLAGRLSYLLDLKGPSIAVDTACSSSLVALHIACQSLQQRECNLAIVGGVSLILSPLPTISLSKFGIMAPDGRCKTFDSRADGYVRGEGCGVVILKRLSSALSDGENILAHIRGSSVNQDGRGAGLTAPNVLSQQAVLRQALHNSGVNPSQVSCIEAHGTGTGLGDPIEVEALTEVYGQPPVKIKSCAISSVKTNIGHLEAAGGIAGLIKLVLCMQNETIPPHLHFKNLNPNISLENTPFFIPTKLKSWSSNGMRLYAAVSSFGFSGTNAHVILEEATKLNVTSQSNNKQLTEKPYFLPLSARGPKALEALARDYRDFLAKDNSEATLSLRDICYTASVRRSHHEHRLALVADSWKELVKHLESFLEGENIPGMTYGKIANLEQKLVFVFSGQGSQWLGMGRELFEQEPLFRSTLEKCDELFRQYVNWSLFEELMADEDRSRLDQTEVAQPAIFALQVALTSLWRSWGIVPDAVVGHSAGEVAAAYVAGVLSLEEAIRIIFHRSRLMQRATGQGKMVAVGLPLKEAECLIGGFEGSLSIAALNSPISTVLSGDRAALDEILKRLQDQKQNVFFRLLPGSYAFHSSQMDSFQSELVQSLRGLNPQSALIPIFSTVTGRLSDESDFDAAYWGKNIRQPVLFSSTINKLIEDGYQSFLEISPHPVLASSISQCLQHRGHEGVVLSSLRRGKEERAVMLGSLGTLYTRGYSIEWKELFPTSCQHVQLPNYPWQRERYWLENQEMSRWKQLFCGDCRKVASVHPFLGLYLKSAVHSGTHFWEMEFSSNLLPYLGDHRIQGAVMLPAAVYTEMALAAATEVVGDKPYVLENVFFKKALIFPEDEIQRVQLILSPEMPGTFSFQFFSLQPDNEAKQESWTLNSTGTIRFNGTNSTDSIPHHSLLNEIKARCSEVVSSDDFYQTMAMRGLEYGLSFQCLEQIWRKDGEALARLRLPEIVASAVSDYKIHPVILDACFQTLAVTLPIDNVNITRGDIYIPVSISKLSVYDQIRPSHGLWSHAILRSDPEKGELKGDVFLLDKNGHKLLRVLGWNHQRLDREMKRSIQGDISDGMYQIKWEALSRPQQGQVFEQFPPDQRGSWLIFSDSNNVGRKLKSLLEARGETCIMISSSKTYRIAESGHYQLNPSRPEDFQQLLQDVFGYERSPCRGIVHLWSLDIPPADQTTSDSIETEQQLGSYSVLHLVQAIFQNGWQDLPRLWLVTCDAMAVGTKIDSVSIGQSPLWGLGRVIAHEHADLRCTLIDLSRENLADDINSLFTELWSDEIENQIAFRGKTYYVARLMRYSPEATTESLPASNVKELIEVSDDHPFRLEITRPGLLDSLVFREANHRTLAQGQVEIQTYATGLNFRDIMKAMGIYPTKDEDATWLGDECAGKIIALGEGVEDLQIDDEVIALAPFSFSSFVTTSASFVVTKPSHLSFEEAATIPVAFLTSCYALYHLAKLSKGERVLIHAAAGGVGLAAVQLAQRVGAEIFATAGSSEKRKYLQSLGVKHVMDSRSLAFADEIMKITDGKGMDVVLNSLSGEAIPKSLSLLGAYGRFLEIGKRDIYQNSKVGLQPFQNNLSFFAIDMNRLFRERADFARSLLLEVMKSFTDGSLKPLPMTVFPISEVVHAFRHMSQTKHIGKIALSYRNQRVKLVSAFEATVSLHSDTTYLITGGLGGLGLTVARWMVEQGVRHLVLIGRSEPSATAQEALEAMRDAGAEVVVAKADVTQEQQLSKLLSEIDQTMPALRGIIHAAGILDDGILLRQDQQRFKSVMAPKTIGAWNLHKLTLEKSLDFFVLFSSVASLLGSPGQGNYSAANAFLDALAHYRRVRGLKCLSINWGPWARVGWAAQLNREGRFAYRGVDSITPEEGVEILGRLLTLSLPQIGIMHVNWQQWRQSYPNFSKSPLLSKLVDMGADITPKAKHLGKKGGSTRNAILAAEPEMRRQLLEDYFRELVARLLELPASKLDIEQPLNNLGVDSLLAVEIKNRIELNLGVDIPVMQFVQGPSITRLATILLDQLVAGDSEWPSPVTPPGKSDEPEQKNGRPKILYKIDPEKAKELLTKIDQLPEAEVDLLLSNMLD